MNYQRYHYGILRADNYTKSKILNGARCTQNWVIHFGGCRAVSPLAPGSGRLLCHGGITLFISPFTSPRCPVRTKKFTTLKSIRKFP